MVNVFLLGDDRPYVAIRFDREPPPSADFRLIASFPNDEFAAADQLASWVSEVSLGEDALFFAPEKPTPTAH